MDATELVERLARVDPTASCQDLLRIGLVLCNEPDATRRQYTEESLREDVQRARLRLQAAADQHGAMTAELESLTRTDPTQFDKQQVWVLIRAIKVQSQILGMYLGERALDV